MDKLYIIKIGGNIIDDAERLAGLLRTFAAIKGNRILVHGGGKLASSMAAELQVPQQIVEGRRITDAPTLKIITMVYAGLINKNIVAALQEHQCNAAGFCGADGNAITAHRRISGNFGFVGDIDRVNTDFFRSLLQQDIVPVIAPLTHDGKGQLLNTNADTIASAIATALSPFYNTSLVYTFEKPGVLLQSYDESAVISELRPANYAAMKKSGAIFAGMIPKLDNAFAAVSAGVSKVIIGKAEDLPLLLTGEKGTTILHD